jgi:sulfur-oxidizing protein SoxX
MVLGMALTASQLPAAPYLQWTAKDFAIAEPLGGLQGDPRRGRQIAISRSRGNCLACHHMPIPEEEFHGTLGPPLEDVGARLTEGQIRLRIVDEKQINPESIMPGFYRDPRHFYRVLDEYEGKTVLTPQEVEDVVAYLLSFKGIPK